MEGLGYHLCGNLDNLVRAEANWDLRALPSGPAYKTAPFCNSFNSILEFRLTMSPLPFHYLRAFLLLILAQDVRNSSFPLPFPPSLIPPLAHQLSS